MWTYEDRKTEEYKAMSGATCKGSWILGSACKRCDRCRDTAIGHIEELYRGIQNIQKAAKDNLPRNISVDELGNPTGFDGGRFVAAKAVLDAIGDVHR